MKKNRVLTMSMGKLYHFTLCLFVLLSVSACETMGLKHYNRADGKSVEVKESDMTPMPSLRGSDNPVQEEEASSSSVEIFDMELNPEYQRGVAVASVPSVDVQPVMARPPSSPVWNSRGGTIQSSDSSVTIYDLDGSGPSSMGEMVYGNYPVPSHSHSSHHMGSGAAGEIFFKHGSSRLGSGDMRKISSLADEARFAPVNYVTVSGYASKPTQAGTDTTQAHIINLRQSLKRSEKVTKALIHKGVPAEKLKTVGWGSGKATGNNSRDRRVDIVMGEQ